MISDGLPCWEKEREGSACTTEIGKVQPFVYDKCISVSYASRQANILYSNTPHNIIYNTLSYHQHTHDTLHKLPLLLNSKGSN